MEEEAEAVAAGKAREVAVVRAAAAANNENGGTPGWAMS